MQKHKSNKHDEYQNFKMHLDAEEQKACCNAKMLTQDPIKLLGTAALAGVLLGLLI
jgi:ElaB/YqjD/DUF883 family membrane-anchored ribosome-binding protein